jgi:hypothetical protein
MAFIGGAGDFGSITPPFRPGSNMRRPGRARALAQGAIARRRWGIELMSLDFINSAWVIHR